MYGGTRVCFGKWTGRKVMLRAGTEMRKLDCPVQRRKPNEGTEGMGNRGGSLEWLGRRWMKNGETKAERSEAAKTRRT